MLYIYIYLYIYIHIYIYIVHILFNYYSLTVVIKNIIQSDLLSQALLSTQAKLLNKACVPP